MIFRRNLAWSEAEGGAHCWAISNLIYNKSHAKAMAVKSYLRALKKELTKHDIKFEQNKTIAGIKVPISFPASKVAVMIDECTDGCGCPEHYKQPAKDNSPWGAGPSQCSARIERERHKLMEEGWKVLRFWEHDVDRSPENVAAQIFMELGIDQ